jgi:hypothetical protein
MKKATSVAFFMDESVRMLKPPSATEAGNALQ